MNIATDAIKKSFKGAKAEQSKRPLLIDEEAEGGRNAEREEEEVTDVTALLTSQKSKAPR